MGSKSSTPSSHFDLLRQAEKLSSSEKYEEAIDMYNQSVEMNPNYYLTYLGRGKCFCKLGQYDEALLDFEAVLELSEECHAARMYKVNCLEELEEFELAAMERSRIPVEVRRQSEEYTFDKDIPNHPLASSFPSSTALTKERLENGQRRKDSGAPRSQSFSGVMPDSNDDGGYGNGDDACTVSDSDTIPSTPLGEIAQRGRKQEGQQRHPSEGKGEQRPRPRHGDIVDDEDRERFTQFRDSWVEGMRRQKNISDFLHGRRGWYVQSRTSKRNAEIRADRRSQMAMYELGMEKRGQQYSRVGGK